MNRLKSVAINSHPPHCYQGEDEEMPCCKDVSEELKIDELTKVSFNFKVNPDVNQLVAIACFLVDQQLIPLEKKTLAFQNYAPPPTDRDVLVLIQSFLI